MLDSVADYPFVYRGDDNTHMIYGEVVKIVEDFPQGVTVRRGIKLSGHWCKIEDNDGRQCYVYRATLAAR